MANLSILHLDEKIIDINKSMSKLVNAPKRIQTRRPKDPAQYLHL